jgi:putative ABC transport system ATP-binding protein
MSHAASARDRSVIQLKNLKKSYSSGNETIEILKGITFDINQSDFVAITGPSGAGKSTLLHILGCMDLPTSGSYLLGGNDVGTLDDDQLSHLRSTSIGFVFQAFNVIPQLDVYENIEVPFFYQGNLNQENRERIFHCIELVGLSHRIHHKPSQLSGGEIQRVAIARALAIDPILILADEPTGNLDSKTGQNIIDLFQSLNEKGVTIVIVTHNDQVAESTRRWISLYDGQIQNDKKVRA